jgi:hypothetical protein
MVDAGSKQHAVAHAVLRVARMARLACAAAVLLATSDAAADPRFAVGLDYTIARGGALEAWDLGWRIEAGPMVRIGRWQATASASAHLGIDTTRPERDSDQLFGWGLGGRLAYHIRVDGHGALLVALGFERIGIGGSQVVRRECRFTRACVAGYYPEMPDYDAWAPQLRVGIGPFTNLPDMVFGGTFELIVEPMRVRDVPPDGIAGVALYGAFTFTMGFGPKRRGGR